MKILVTGAAGQLGREVVGQLRKSHLKVAGLSHSDLDITDKNNVSNCFSMINPDFVVNCAAYTQVDDAETFPQKAFNINRKGAAFIAESCHSRNIPLIHISTDFVFDGRKKAPYAETDSLNPLGIYGKSKALGEQEITRRLDRFLIIRTSWLYGVYGRNFVKTMMSLAANTNLLKVVSDQFGCPTSATDFACVITDILKQKNNLNDRSWGIYHYSGEGVASWHEFAETIFKFAALNPMPTVHPISTDQYPTRAERPPYSVLDCHKINSVFGIQTKPWQESLSIVVNRLLSEPKSYLFP